MKTMFNNVIFLSVLMLMIIVGRAQADQEAWSDKYFEKKAAHKQKIFEKLNLSDEQKKQIEANKEKNMALMKESFEQMKMLKSDFKEELMKETLNKEAIQTIHAKIKESHARMMDERLNSMLEIRQILTHEQFKEFSKLMKKEKMRGNKKKD